MLLFQIAKEIKILSWNPKVDDVRLVNYTPPAAVIRLISLNCINLWLTMFIISLTGYDPELYLLAWIIMASVKYHSLVESLVMIFSFCRSLVSFKISLPAILPLIGMVKDHHGIFICVLLGKRQLMMI
jgi:N-glycosylation protein